MRPGISALVWVLVSLLAPPLARGADLLIRNARLVEGTGAPPREPVAIRIEDGRIAAIAADLPGRGEPVLDAAGATVLPGLIDANVFLSDVPGADHRGDPPSVRWRLVTEHLRAYLACGVTTVLDTGIDPEAAKRIRRWLADGNPGPTFLTLGPSFNAPGGFVARPFPHGSVPVATPEEVEALLDVVIETGGVGVGVMLERGPELLSRPIHTPRIRAAISGGAARRGLAIFVHARTEREQTIGLDMGARAGPWLRAFPGAGGSAMKRTIFVLVALGLCLAGTLDRPVVHAVETCKVKLDARTGVINVSATGLSGTLLWGDRPGSATNTFFNAATCISGRTATQCQLGAPGSPEAIIPPDLCMMWGGHDNFPRLSLQPTTRSR
jgi:hypothetical protein